MRILRTTPSCVAFFERNTNLFDGRPKRMLLIAPEKEFIQKISQIPDLEYITVDLYKPSVMLRMDLINLAHSDNTMDIIYCSHILEHIPKDVKAMEEVYRVLTDIGWAVLVVPITADKTLEAPDITDPLERDRLFGQRDHVRRYGPDFVERLEEAGFHIREYTSLDIVGETQIDLFGTKDRALYFCRKHPF